MKMQIQQDREWLKACTSESDKFGFTVYRTLSKLLKVYEPQPQNGDGNTSLTGQLQGLSEVKHVKQLAL